MYIFGLSHAYLYICQAFWHAFFELNLTLVHCEAIYHSETDGSREKRRADLNRSRGAWCEMWLCDIIFEDGLEIYWYPMFWYVLMLGIWNILIIY